MKCPKCGAEMNEQEYGVDCLEDEVICISTYFYCNNCDTPLNVNTWYKKMSEEIEYNE
jgi:hypothetical protein